MKDAIGGYFGLEFRKGEHFHHEALRLNTGRNCLEYILRARGYAHIWIPYYTCEVLLEPLRNLGIQYSFYPIDTHFEPVTLPELQSNDAFLFTNYYGLKQQTVERLADHYGSRLIVDDAQAFFAPRINHIDTFYTARKFFGVPDGAYLYTDKLLKGDIPQDESYANMSHLLKRIDKDAECGYADYQLREQQLCNQPIKRMSAITERILCSIDYAYVRRQRIANYNVLHTALRATNNLSLELGDAVPMVYPYMPGDGSILRSRLQQQRIYTAKYWDNILQWNSPEWEQSLVNHMLPLPLDQRYDITEMKKIISFIL